MKKRLRKYAFPALLLLLLATSGFAQQRDPLTDSETDQLRELAQEPEKRLKLILKFTRARMATLEQIQGDPRLMAADRGNQVHNLLEDITSLTDELDDNIDDYMDKKLDIRKALKEVIEADTDFQLKLRTLHDRAMSSKEFSNFNFALQTATEAVNGSLDSARQSLQEQEQTIQEEKEREKKKQKKE